MLDILECFIAQCGHSWTRLDGTTSVAERQAPRDAFNAPTSNLFVFLLTTRAGGIGVNRVGADRVVVFDPDWKPSTDVQARECAWHVGQQKLVTVCRIVTAGTIEEKIYHRQFFKQYLTSKVLHDAKRKRCFNKHSPRDLFILDESDDDEGVAETNALFLAGNVTRPTKVDGKEQEHERVDPVVPGDNDVVLQRLFDAGDVRNVFDHSTIKATKIAQGALSALRASGGLARQQRETIFTPTWTGRSGTAGHPSQRHKEPKGHHCLGKLQGRGPRGRGGRGGRAGGGVSSREMLARIQPRREGVAPTTKNQPLAATSSTSPSRVSAPLTANEIAKRLHAFLVAHAATGVTIEWLLENFRDMVAPKDKLVFRHVLREMALCRGRRWTLKPLYSLAS
ncbi:hypothetical protein PsorP6_006741 [Peronosclerospora sorghi]|uniref:Uncharacterized protein n=1 Tax=Peronosclerospora sorghi TaxID=230839 RepID=A0ACC0W115_9STRA|nr:hypothetical protein PsorP6_006741 [Peronosclerospora sorghi]